MWFVQNPDEPRTTTQLYANQQAAKNAKAKDAKSETTVTGNVLY